MAHARPVVLAACGLRRGFALLVWPAALLALSEGRLHMALPRQPAGNPVRLGLDAALLECTDKFKNCAARFLWPVLPGQTGLLHSFLPASLPGRCKKGSRGRGEPSLWSTGNPSCLGVTLGMLEVTVRSGSRSSEGGDPGIVPS